MNHAVHNKIVSFIWSIADDCLRDIYVRRKYRDVILPMVVLRRLDSLLEPSKNAVLKEAAFQKKQMGLVELDGKGLEDAAGFVFYNTSKWTLKKLFTIYDSACGSGGMLKKRRDELELYKLLAGDTAFKSAMQQNLRQIVNG